MSARRSEAAAAEIGGALVGDGDTRSGGAPIITFLSDFGLRDPFVGLCHCVVAQIAPSARVVDLSHAIRPQDVRHGAQLLEDCVAIAPGAVHLAVVDPGVGSDRRPVAVRTASGGLLVGPDNGLLPPAADRLGGADAAWELADPAYRRAGVSRTFHGRDVFAPAAAHLAAGLDPALLGPPVPLDALVRIHLADFRARAGELACEIRDIDVFGNVQLPLRSEDATRAGLVAGGEVTVISGEHRQPAAIGATFADAPPGGLVVLEDSFGWLAVARNGGSAADLLGAGPGGEVVLRTGHGSSGRDSPGTPVGT